MLDNTITLAVDLLNTGSTTDEVYTRHEEFQNRSVYAGPNHTLSERETMTCYRTFPKQSGNFRGVAKSAVKLSADVEVDGVDSTTSVNATELAEASFSLPVGTSSARAVALRQRLIAAIDHAFMTALTEKLEV